MKAIQIVIFLIMFILTINCFAENLDLIPVTNPSERISSMGLSVLPPQGDNWYIIQNNPLGGLNFAKTMEDSTHTFTCHILVVPLDKEFKNPAELLAWVKQSHQSDADPRRFKNQEYNYDLNERFSLHCVKYQMKATDIQRKTAGGTYLILKAHGYMFIHPKSSKYVVNIYYSERGTAQNFTPSFRTAGDGFIDNLIIE